MTMKIGIAGLTGKIGSLTATHLLKHEVLIRGYVRSPKKLPKDIIDSEKVEIITGDAFDEDKVGDFVKGLDVVICGYLGDSTLMVDGQKLLIDACEEAGVPRFIASDWTGDYTKLEAGLLFPKDPMKEIMAYLETQEKVKGVHILVGVLPEIILSPVYGCLNAETKTWQYWGEGDEIMEGTTYRAAAEFTAYVVLDQEAVGIQRCKSPWGFFEVYCRLLTKSQMSQAP